jgi:hypothetical protein
MIHASHRFVLEVLRGGETLSRTAVPGRAFDSVREWLDLQEARDSGELVLGRSRLLTVDPLWDGKGGPPGVEAFRVSLAASGGATRECEVSILLLAGLAREEAAAPRGRGRLDLSLPRLSPGRGDS